MRSVRITASSLFPQLKLDVHVRGGAGVHGGVTYPDDGGYHHDLAWREVHRLTNSIDDWMLTHEMIHLAFPSMARTHHWIEEGISVYVEPVARVQAGQLSAERMWSDVVRDMPQGEPEAGDNGLDRTHTWGRTYWGGAMFCLVADVRIRQKTGNHKGLQDALRGILACRRKHQPGLGHRARISSRRQGNGNHRAGRPVPFDARRARTRSI